MPDWCDLTCPEADWPEEEALDGSGSCRTFLALYCKKHQRITAKNGPCLDRAAKPYNHRPHSKTKRKK